ncbi:MAG: DnaJ domain-containing protein [Ktedonobacterales bacterium]
MRQDFYAVLGVDMLASAEEIRQAYRARAREYHPDARPNNPQDPAAAEQFKLITEAYRVLGTPNQRVAYDRALTLMQSSASRYATHPPLPRATTPELQVSDDTPRRYDQFHHFASAHDPLGAGASEGPPERANPRPPRATLPTPGLGPALTLTVTPGTPAIAPSSTPTRFYALTEIAAPHEAALLEPLPLDLALVIDRSNSMRGHKLFEAKKIVVKMLDQLRPDDLLTVIFFDDRAETLADGETTDGRAGIEMALNRMVVQGSTRLAVGLGAALDCLSRRQSRARVSSLLMITDGLTYGDEPRCYELAASARQRGISITTLGIGLEWNRKLLDRLAAVGGGSSNFVAQPRDAAQVCDEAITRLRATLASDIRLTFTPAPGVKIARALRVAPEIAESFNAFNARQESSSSPLARTPSGELAGAQAFGGQPTAAADALVGAVEPVTVELGSLAGRADAESVVVLWELLLDPLAYVPHESGHQLGEVTAHYWAARQHGAQWERLHERLCLPVTHDGRPLAVATDVRLALELITAYQLQTGADGLAATGRPREAARRLATSALRLRSAGAEQLADQADHAAQEVATASEAGRTAALSVKYSTKNLSLFHKLRRQLRERVGVTP